MVVKKPPRPVKAAVGDMLFPPTPIRLGPVIVCIEGLNLVALPAFFETLKERFDVFVKDIYYF